MDKRRYNRCRFLKLPVNHPDDDIDNNLPFFSLFKEYTMDIFFRQWWTDPRLAHNFTTPFNMAGDATKMIWTPDTFFWNVKAAKYHKVTRENMRIKIHGDGNVYFSTR